MASHRLTLRCDIANSPGMPGKQVKLAAAEAIAGIVSPDELSEEYVIPSGCDRRGAARVADALERAAYATGVARRRRGLDNQALESSVN